MQAPVLSSLTAAAALLPLALLPLMRSAGGAGAAGDALAQASPAKRPDTTPGAIMDGPALPAAIALGALGAAGAAAYQLIGGWNGGLGLALTVAVAAVALLYAAQALADAHSRRLAPLLGPYLVLLALAAAGAGLAESTHSAAATAPPDPWLIVHIVLSVGAYACLTLAATAGLAVMISEAALKRHRPGGLAAALPPLSISDRLQHRMMLATFVILGAAIAAGIAESLVSGRPPLAFDHKTVLSLAGMAAIGALLLGEQAWGLRGRRAARWVLAAFLLITLAFPGVKLVTGILLVS